MNNLLKCVFFIPAISFYLSFTFVTITYAEEGMWQEGGLATLPCTYTAPSFTTDGSNGTIIAALQGNSLYAMHCEGYSNYPNSGKLVYTGLAQAYIKDPYIVTDNAGGAILIWKDGKNGVNFNIFSQRINTVFIPQWSADGVAIRNLYGATSYVKKLKIIADGAGGAIIAWLDYRSGSRYDIYAQRINQSGAVQWTSNGVLIYSLSTTGIQTYELDMVSNGSGGAIIAWRDTRSVNPDVSIYAQCIANTGTVQWIDNGVPIVTAANDRGQSLTMISDGSGGAILAWEDERSGNKDIYSQRINNSGIVQWTANGVPVCNISPSDQYHPTLTHDSLDGVIISWYYQESPNSFIMAQRLDGAGTPQWIINGIIIRSNPYWCHTELVVSDLAGGAIIAWRDQRPATPTSGNVYAQRINGSGVTLWQTDGVPITSMGNVLDLFLHSDNSGGAIIGWQANSIPIAYAQRILSPRPSVATISSPAMSGKVYHASITGTYFHDDHHTVTAVKLTRTASADIIATNLVISDATAMTCDFDLTSIGSGDWSLVVNDSLGQISQEAVTVSIIAPTTTPTATGTMGPSATPTASPTATITPIEGFSGKLLDKKFTYFAPNPARGNYFKFTVHVPRQCEIEGKLYTTGNRFVLKFNLDCPGPGQYEHREYVGNLANGVYLLLVKAKGADGTRERLIKKLALIK